MRKHLIILLAAFLASCKVQQRVAYYEKKTIIHDTLIQIDTAIVIQPDTTVVSFPCDTVERVIVKESNRSKVTVTTGKQGTVVTAVCKEEEIRLKFQRIIRKWYNHITEKEKVAIKRNICPFWLIVLAITGWGLFLYKPLKTIIKNIKRLWL